MEELVKTLSDIGGVSPEAEEQQRDTFVNSREIFRRGRKNLFYKSLNSWYQHRTNNIGRVFLLIDIFLITGLYREKSGIVIWKRWGIILWYVIRPVSVNLPSEAHDTRRHPIILLEGPLAFYQVLFLPYDNVVPCVGNPELELKVAHTLWSVNRGNFLGRKY